MAHEGQHQSPLELITQNVRSILADVLNKLEFGDVDHSIDFVRYRVEWLCSVLVRLGGSLEEKKPTAAPTRGPAIPCHSRQGRLF